VDPLAPNTHQIHDFNLDIDPFPGGVFWTKAMEADVVEVDLEDRDAELRVSGLRLTDYFTLANSFADGALLGSKPATVSFEVQWRGGGAAKTIGDGTNFAARVIEDTAAIHWRGEEEGFRFTSLTSTTHFAEIGTESNGIFL
jgi:hypothetical protein